MIPHTLAFEFDVAQIGALLTGSCGALVLAVGGLWWQSRQVDKLGTLLQDKDKEILALAKEAIACITNVTILSQSTQVWQATTTAQLNRMEDHKP